MTNIDLFEVITTRPSDGQSYGITFHNRSTANAYAQAMQRRGYHVDPFPVFNTRESAAEALQEALAFYGVPE